MPETIDADAVVIGAGSGGLTVAVGLAGFGRRVVLAERGPFGGDCTNTGCVPSKRLIHLARGGRGGAAALADVRSTRDGLSAHERAELTSDPNVTVVEGDARLAGPREVVIDRPDGSVRVRARHIVVATGAAPAVLDVPGLPSERVLTSDGLFEQDAPPGRLVVLGAGAVGLEMAAAFRRLGTRVDVVEVADRVLPAADPEASAVVAARLGEMGVGVHTGGQVAGYEAASGAVLLDVAGAQVRIDGVDRVLMAVGRRPRVDGLGLDVAGVRHGPQGIPVDRWGRTNVRSVWAVGDVVPGSHQTHAANALGRRVVQRIALPWLPAVGRPPAIPSAVFCEPEVAWVEDPARRRRATVRVRVDVAGTDRGLTDGVTRGFVMVDAERLTGRIRRAVVVGPAASELVAVFAVAIRGRVSLLRLARTVWAYPTHAGAIGKVADAFARLTLGDLPGQARLAVLGRVRGG